MSQMPRIPREEFDSRLRRIQQAMDPMELDTLVVYGDEYRKENLRYVCNFWPIFERAAGFIPRSGEPILASACEGQQYAKEMSVWTDVRNIKELACVSVPEEIDYPLAEFSSFEEVLKETSRGGGKIGLVGLYDIPKPIFDRLQQAAPGVEIVDADSILTELRLIKTEAEVACLAEAGSQACQGYQKLLELAGPGNTERQAAGAAEGAARMAGAEDINFTVFGSGERTSTIIGRTADKVIEDGDMVMAAMAVQHEGYVATVEYPFVAGKASDAQRRFLAALFEAADVQLKYLKDGAIGGEMVRAVKAVFRTHDLQRYDVYPPMHGIGLAEAESPYPDERSDYPLRSGMCVNSDISLFGTPAGSNRIEEGFVIRPDGAQSLTPLLRQLCRDQLG